MHEDLLDGAGDFGLEERFAVGAYLSRGRDREDQVALADGRDRHWELHRGARGVGRVAEGCEGVGGGGVGRGGAAEFVAGGEREGEW